MTNAFTVQCILVIAKIMTVLSGKQIRDPGEITKHFFGLINVDVEPYVYDQLALEEIAKNVSLYDSPERERSTEIRELLKNPRVRGTISKCEEFHNPPHCTTSLYRTYDGTCNNQQHPMWGSANYMMDRFLPANYDGISQFRKSVSGGELPHPRNISLKLVDRNNPTETVSALFTFFGQFIAHDISSAPAVTKNGEEIDCCSPKERDNPSCKNIQISPDDPFYKKFNFTCFPFTRTAPYPKCNFEKRNPMNKETSFLDASTVYGYHQTIAEPLRLKDGSGKLKSQKTVHGELLPKNHKQDLLFCPRMQTTNCFTAGDERVNQHAMLTTMHTVFLRFHNALADRLHAMNPKWGEEKLYQELRRIVIAVYQYIAYTEYLSWVVPPQTGNELELSVDEDSFYDDEVNPSAMAEFTTGSFRLHSMVPKRVSKEHPHLRFLETYSNPKLLLDGETESLVSGSCDVPSEKNDRYLKIDINNYLYKPPGADFGTDLTSADIQRGRDHGLPIYIEVVKKCSDGKIIIRQFSDLSQIMPDSNVQLLRSIYKDVRDIDLLIGIYMEKRSKYFVTGYTAACLSAEQFHRLKFGDSFFFSHTNSRNPFTKKQLNSIRSFSFAQLICEAGGFPSIRRFPLSLPNDDNDLVDCSSLPLFDLGPWRDS